SEYPLGNGISSGWVLVGGVSDLGAVHIDPVRIHDPAHEEFGLGPEHAFGNLDLPPEPDHPIQITVALILPISRQVKIMPIPDIIKPVPRDGTGQSLVPDPCRSLRGLGGKGPGMGFVPVFFNGSQNLGEFPEARFPNPGLYGGSPHTGIDDPYGNLVPGVDFLGKEIAD